MDSKPIPEVMRENKQEVSSVLLRTVLKKEIYEELKSLAKEYSTGQGHWDFGVAIQILLDNFNNVKNQIQAEKLDAIISILTQDPQEGNDVKEIEMLGGSKLRI